MESHADFEDVYGLSPLQQGMLIHTLREQGVGMYLNQAVYRVEYLDVDAIRSAWQRVVDRHAVLRTSFHWEDLENPRQVVHRHVELPLETFDWSDVPPAEQETRLRQFLQSVRARGFDLRKPPLLRLAAIRVSPTAHLVVWAHHHILLDGWSAPVILGEVQAFYRAAQSGQELDLPQPRPFRDYIQWLERQDKGRAERFWRRYLEGFASPTPLPADRGAPPAAEGAGQRPRRPQFGSWAVEFDADRTQQLQALARRCQVTVNTVVQAAWALVLGRYAQQSDVVFGILVSGRPPELTDVESIVGMFLNTVPLRVRIDGAARLEDWLKDLRRQYAEAQQHEHTPLMEVQSWAAIPRGVPLFGSIVASADAGRSGGGGRRGGDGGRFERIQAGGVQQNYPLHLAVHSDDAGLSLTMTYDAVRFAAASITRLMEQTRTLLEAMVVDAGQQVDDLPMMSEGERDQVLVRWNQTAVPVPHDFCLHQIFEAQAAKTPDAPAVRQEDGSLSYRELNEQANRLARHLVSLGVRRGSLVGLCVERSPAMAAGLLAALKAGAAYVPLDPHYPQERLEFMLADSGASVLLTTTEHASRFSGTTARIVCLDRDEADWRDLPSENPENVAGPEDLAYVLYTSGSTGKPKGVAAPHRVPVNRLHTEPEPWQAGESICAKTSLSFVDSIWELFSAWGHGLCATLAAESQVRDPAALAGVLASVQATRVVLVPSLLRAWLEAEIDLEQALPRLKHWVSSGEALPGDLCAAFAKRLPGRVLTNLYGTSEIWDATRCDSREFAEGKPLPIGRPMGNVRVYVLDEKLRPVPIGLTGELYVGGDGLARGYWRRPELTAERFVPDPFGAAGDRLYRTGDVVRWLADGNLEYVGRRDQQLKLRGFRVEPGDIESVLREHEDVENAAVRLFGERLIAYVTPRDGRQASTTVLREFAHRRLPEHMLPAAYVALDRMPLTPSGKLDRRSLPDPQQSSEEAPRESDAPRTDVERLIAQTWAGVLGVGSVGLHDNFFELGGHSLAATRAAVRLGKAFGVDVPLAALFEAPTVAAMALRIESLRQAGEQEDDVPELAQTEHGREAPLSFTQQRLWFLDQLNPGISSYTIPNVARFSGPFDLEALESALAEVIRRHEVLRTTFVARDGEPLQVIHPPRDVALPFVDVSHLEGEEQENEVRRHAREQARLPWDLAGGPLYRFRVLRLSPEEHALVTSVHHIICDGRSIGIFGQELAMLYNTLRQGLPSPLRDLPLQYADFAIWERNFVKGKLYEKQLDYWKRKLAGMAPIELPVDRPRPSVHRFRGSRVTFKIPAELADRLRELSLEESGTLYMALLAGFQVMVGRYAGQNDVGVGSAFATRSRQELENLIGLFVNTLVMRNDVSADQTFRQLLKRTRELTVEAFANQDLPFESMVNELQPERDLSRQGSPLFQVMFVHNPVRSSAQQGMGGVRMSQQGVDTQFSNFDLLLATTEGQGGVNCTLSYNIDIFDESTVERMAERLQLLLERVGASPDVPLSRIGLLSDEERHRALVEWNRSAPVPDALVHELVARHAQTRPDHPAARYPGGEMSYGELDRRAEGLARKLRSLGVGPERIVGLCADRSSEMLVGLLAILKAGGAFLPLDPAYPAERLAQMVRRSGAEVVLTQEHLRELLPADLGTLVSLTNDGEGDVAASESESAVRVHSRNLAYVIFTSGSTGTPKGVLVEHGGFLNTIHAQVGEFRIGPESRVLQMLSLSFDAAVGEIFRGLVGGATLYLWPKGDLLPGPDLCGLLREERITVVALPPSALGAMPEGESLPDLKTLTVGGEACPASLAARWGTGRRILNGYGPTETTIGATLAADWDLTRKPPIGKPLPNVRAYVLDRDLQPVAVGIPGELYIGGAGVTRGYAGRPDLTAERFLPDPFAEEPGTRMYRTGDLVRWLADGALDFLGRADQQVKIRGFRIELGEIESALGEHDQVAQCVVDVHEQRGMKRLVGYVTPAGEEAPAPAELKRFLHARLPEYMVPAFLIVLPRLPLTVNGKIDRAALPAPEIDQLSTVPYVAPETDVERTLADIWTRVLGVERVGTNDSFFELGGDSILSIQMVARAAEAGVAMTARDLFQYQTIGELAKVVGAGTLLAAAGDATGEIPLTPIQARRLEQEPSRLNEDVLSFSAPTSAAVQIDLLRESFRQLVHGHDALRLRFERDEEGAWRQLAAPPEDLLPVDYVDLSSLDAAEQDAAVQARTTELSQGLNLARGPVVRLAWFQLGRERRGRLFLVAHRLIADEPSLRLLVQELTARYKQTLSGRAPRPPADPGRFRMWAESLRAAAGMDSIREEARWWLDPKRQSGAWPTPENAKHAGASEPVDTELDQAETRAVLEAAKARRATIREVLLTALGRVLCRLSGETRTVVSVEEDARRCSGIPVNASRVVGLLENAYPVALEVPGDADWNDALDAVREELRGVPNYGLAYGVIRQFGEDDELRQALRAGDAPPFAFRYDGPAEADAAFAALASPRVGELSGTRTGELTGTRNGGGRCGSGPAAPTLRVDAWFDRDRLRIRWDCRPEFIGHDTIKRLVEEFRAALRELVERCSADGPGRLSPLDFPEARLSEQDFDALMRQLQSARPETVAGNDSSSDPDVSTESTVR